MIVCGELLAVASLVSCSVVVAGGLSCFCMFLQHMYARVDECTREREQTLRQLSASKKKKSSAESAGFF